MDAHSAESRSFRFGWTARQYGQLRLHFRVINSDADSGPVSDEIIRWPICIFFRNDIFISSSISL